MKSSKSLSEIKQSCEVPLVTVRRPRYSSEHNLISVAQSGVKTEGHISRSRRGPKQHKINSMAESVLVNPIGYVRSPYSETSQIPKGCGAQHEAEGVLEVLAEYEQGLIDIEGFSHLFVIWVFDRAEGFELLGTPPTDTRPHGVFATRSPRRPNPIGLTVVKLLNRDGCRLRVAGVDMLDGTPILDIKPYLSSIPIDELKRGWLAEAEARKKAS
jgi:tRNA (adenine37-N6)-methyltransferase